MNIKDFLTPNQDISSVYETPGAFIYLIHDKSTEFNLSCIVKSKSTGKIITLDRTDSRYFKLKSQAQPVFDPELDEY